MSKDTLRKITRT